MKRSTGISVLTSLPTEEIHPAPSVYNSPAGCYESFIVSGPPFEESAKVAVGPATRHLLLVTIRGGRGARI